MALEKDVYIVLTGTSTWLGTLIQWVTGLPLNHASIAFDDELKEVYSFGRKKTNNPFIGGLVKENFRDAFYNETYCAVFRCQVSRQDYKRMQRRIQQMLRQQQLYKYNLIGLFGVLLKIRLERKNTYFCSQFVASVLEETSCQPVKKPSCLVTPEDFADGLATQEIYRGLIADYIDHTGRSGRSQVASTVAPTHAVGSVYQF